MPRVLFVAAAVAAVSVAAAPSTSALFGSSKTTRDLFAPATTGDLFPRSSTTSERDETGESGESGESGVVGADVLDYDFRGRGDAGAIAALFARVLAVGIDSVPFVFLIDASLVCSAKPDASRSGILVQRTMLLPPHI